MKTPFSGKKLVQISLPFAPEDIEQEIQTKGLTAPRVTPADIEANIMGESACASPENFDAELGRKIALKERMFHSKGGDPGVWQRGE